jgi:hypothetical protein
MVSRAQEETRWGDAHDVAQLKELNRKLKETEPLTLKAHLLGEGHSEDLISLVLARDGEEGEDSAIVAVAVAVVV